MPISSLSQLRSDIDAAPTVSVHKEPVAFPLVGVQLYQTGWGQIWDYWAASGYPSAGANPSTPAGTQYSKASAGAVQIGNTVGGSTYCLANVQAQASWNPNTYPPPGIPTSANTDYFIHVWDRIWANGALPLSSTARQSWAFPALTRYTSGLGLSLWFREYSNPVSSPNNTTITTEYVNSDGVSRTFAFSFPANTIGFADPYSAIPLPLALGDRGIRSISASTLSTAIQTGGTYGFMIAKYLGCYRVNSAEVQSATSFLSALSQFDGNACLAFGVQIGGSVGMPAGSATAATPGTMPRIAFEAKVLSL